MLMSKSSIHFMLLGSLLCSSMTAGCRTDKALDTGTEKPHESDEAPLIQYALDCALNNDYRLPASTVATSDDFHRVTLNDPKAVCNDGTPAVIFIRSAATNSDRWVFHLQGGGSCAEHDCAERWCENMNLMSSTNAPEAVIEEGLFSLRNDNVFADANYVFVPYCSSDNHVGTSGETVIAADDTMRSSESTFKVMRLYRQPQQPSKTELPLMMDSKPYFRWLQKIKSF